MVQGCQEDKTYIRSDAPTGSRHAFFLTLAFGSQKGWKITSFDARPAYLQPEGITRLLLIRMPWQNPPPGTQPGQVLAATGSIYGTCDAGRGWYLHSKDVFKSKGCLESRLEKRFYFLPSPGSAQDPGFAKDSIIGVFHIT